MNNEYIERKEVFNLANKLKSEFAPLHRLVIDAFVYSINNNIPSVDVVEVRHGKWISASKKQGVQIGMKCSLCGARIKYSEFFNGNHNYCHKCGAKMDGGK